MFTAETRRRGEEMLDENALRPDDAMIDRVRSSHWGRRYDTLSAPPR
jgi:hypothetical protein